MVVCRKCGRDVDASEMANTGPKRLAAGQNRIKLMDVVFIAPSRFF
jgi:hypothetical protein